MPSSSFLARRLYRVALLVPTGTALAQAPTITAQTPLANAVAAANGSPVTFTFSQPLTANSAAALKVFSSQGGGLRTQAAPAGANGNVLRFAPIAPFRPGETVMSTVTTAAASASGALAQARVSQFTVAVGGTGRGSFAVPATNPDPGVGSNPSGVVVGDVDGDGDLDLLSSSYVNATVSLRLNNGRGNFTVPATNPEIAVGASPAGVVLGDVDGDGDLDLLAGNVNSGTVSVRFNNGAGIFGGGADVAVGDYPSSLAVGDIDGDGDLDLVVTNFNSSTVTARLNNGSGVFTAAATAPVINVGNRPNSIALGDVDGDGDLDFVTANDNSGTVSVRLNNGSGNFGGPATPDMPMGSYPQSAVLGDLDGDGDLDLASADLSGNAVRVRFNDGTGTFTARAATPDAPAGSSPKAVVLGDADADGDLDMLVVGAAGTVTLRLNNGSAGFTTATGTVAVGAGAGNITTGDLDGDGDLDLLTTGAINNTVSVRLNGGTVLATRAGQLATGLTCWPNPAHGTATVQLPDMPGTREATLVLRDAVGRVVCTQRLSLATANPTAELGLTGVAPGLYHVQLLVGKQAFNNRLAVE